MPTAVRPPQRRQLVDWRAAIWAGILGGAVFLGLLVGLHLWMLGSGWVPVRLLASVVLGDQILQPPFENNGRALAVCLLVHWPLSVAFACLIAYVLHRWGMLVGIVGGAAFGLALYAIGFYAVPDLFERPWLSDLRSWMLAVGHAGFGAFVGGLYEALEVEVFVPLEPPGERAN